MRDKRRSAATLLNVALASVSAFLLCTGIAAADILRILPDAGRTDFLTLFA
jgi:hypothetical protein